MSEWIRHRGSKTMPKRLEGVRFEVKIRNGNIISMEEFCDSNFVSQENKWKIYGKHPKDVMPYRILEDDPALPDTDGWIEWHGGKCPVAEGTLVDVIFRDGREASSTPANVIDNRYSADASHAFWYSHGRGNDIVAYRLSKPDWPEDRIDVIGQNGNTGEHYNTEPLAVIENVTSSQSNDTYELQWSEHGMAQTNKYQRAIKGVTVDVYDVLVAFGVTCPAMAHAIKKMLMPGQRGSKDAEQDKREAIQAIERSIELAKGGE